MSEMYVRREEFFTTSDGKWFRTRAGALEHEASLRVAKALQTVRCSCGTERADMFAMCPNLACHEERLALLRGSHAERVKMRAEYRSEWSDRNGQGWMDRRTADKWAARVAVLTYWNVKEALDMDIANYERQIAEEEERIARLKNGEAK